VSGQYNQNLRRRAFDHIFKGVTWTPETWAVPYQSTPVDWDASTYPIQIGTSNWTNNTQTPSDYLVTATINVQLQWDNITAGNYSGIAIYQDEAATDSDLIAYVPFVAPITVTGGASIRIPASSIVISFENTVP
jgi:hypothetical protein